ncbi:MAG: cation transporter [Candidatus Omnitrophica bacterium]|nr:cation transporter [Candidatus Omnitrophota bacterium]
MATKTENPERYYGEVRRVLLIVLALNWGVAFAKIFYGYAIKCSSMSADGFHSLADGTANVIGLIGIHFASQPKDLDHPYGHKKYETFFSLTIGTMLFLVAFNLLKDGISRLHTPVNPNIDIASFVVMLITLAINVLVMRYEYRRGLAIKSDILVSDSVHTKSDIYVSLSVIAALAAIKLGFPIVDPIATILIALFIAYSAYEIMKQSSNVLCDTIAIDDTKKIENIVMAVRGVKSCHKIRSRGRGDDIHLDLHVQVAPDMHVDKAHEISFSIEKSIKKNMPEVSDVLVHIEPKK